MMISKRISVLMMAVTVLFGAVGNGTIDVLAANKTVVVKDKEACDKLGGSYTTSGKKCTYSDSGSTVDIPFVKGTTDANVKDNLADDSSAIATIVNTMYTFAKYISGLIFGVAVIMIVWAGFKYATSQGETKVTEQAKMQIITAGIGIGVALFAMIITKVFAEIFGVA